MKLVIGMKRYCDKKPIETALGLENETLKSSTVVEAPIPSPTIKRKAREIYGKMSAMSLIIIESENVSSLVFLLVRKRYFLFAMSMLYVVFLRRCDVLTFLLFFVGCVCFDRCCGLRSTRRG